MDEQLTYEALIKPIPLQLNLANAQDHTPSKTCQSCALIVPDRGKARRGLIQTGYERVDYYPHFPELKASAKAGCGLCRIFRKTIRKSWAVLPMEEWGIGPVRREEGMWDELLDAPWDRKVKIHKVTFEVENTRASPGSQTDSTSAQVLEDGVVVTLGLEFGPATQFVSLETDFQYGEIGQAISFKVYDSQGEAPDAS